MRKFKHSLFLLFLSSTLSFGQTALATVTGTIADPVGAVIADAPITVRNLENGAVYSASSSATGNYTVAQLPIGDYDLTVTSPGFKTYTHTKFHLAAAQVMREDIVLEIGQATDTVQVTAEASLLKTEGSELVQNITLSQLNNLPVMTVAATNQGFRDPFQSLRMLPGVSYTNGTVNTATINGTPGNSMQVRLDGQTQGSNRSNLLGATGMTQPSVDAVQEVAVMTSSFAAEFGTAGGAVVNMVSKSGTNTFHGSAYDYAVNEVLNARQPYTGLRNPVRQHDWGATFGGPVKLPKLYNGKDKTFFFFSFEQYIERKQITNSNTTVPIPAYRDGNFANVINQENRLLTVAAPGNNSANCPAGTAATTPGQCNYRDPLGRTIQSGTIFDPSSQRTVSGQQVRDPFLNNQVPLTLFDPSAKKVLALIPQPFGVLANSQATSNYQVPYRQDRTSYIPSIKIDHNFNASNHLSVYYQANRSDTPRSSTGADALPDLITQSLGTSAYSKTGRLNYDYTATQSLVLHFGLGYNDTDFNTFSATSNFDPFTQLGLTGQTLASNFPQIVTGVGNTGIGGMNPLGAPTNTGTFDRRPSANFSATYVRGSHTIKLGAEYRKELFPEHTYTNTAGTYTFGNNWTQQPSLMGTTLAQGIHGFQFASFLLGGLSGATVAAPVVAAATKSQSSLYLQDTWKVTRKLTFDYGVRWDYGTYASEKHGRYSSVGLTIPNPAADGRMGARQYESVCNCKFADNYPYAIGPRLGVGYQIDRKTVLRAGVGVVYNSTGVTSGGPANTTFSNTPATGSGQIVGLFKDGIPGANIPTWPTTNPSLGQAPGTVATMPFYLDANAGRPGRLLQWNISLQREINRDLVVEAAYVANRGTWWEASGLAPINSLSVDTLAQYGFTNFTSVTDSNLMTGTLAANKAALAAHGITVPYPSFPTSQNTRQSLLPYPQFSGSSLTGAPLGNTWYDALQLTAKKRFSHGLSFDFSYTYSKNLSLISATNSDIFNRSTSKNLSASDIPQQLRLTAQYVVPSLRSSGLAFVSNKYASAILSGWGVGTYMSYQSAPLVGRPASAGTLPISNFLGRGPGLATLKTDANGKPMNPWSVDWYDYSGNHHTDPIDINCHCFDPTKTVVLNPLAWDNVPNGQWSSSFSSIRDFRGIRIPNENANFSRNFRIKESINLNVRVEFQNIFNRTQLPQITTAQGNLPNFNSFATKNNITGLYSGGFGTIVPTAGTNGMRSGSFVARVTF